MRSFCDTCHRPYNGPTCARCERKVERAAKTAALAAQRTARACPCGRRKRMIQNEMLCTKCDSKRCSELTTIHSIRPPCLICGRPTCISKPIHAHCQIAKNKAALQKRVPFGLKAKACKELTCKHCQQPFPFRRTHAGFRAEFCGPKCYRAWYKRVPHDKVPVHIPGMVLTKRPSRHGGRRAEEQTGLGLRRGK